MVSKRLSFILSPSTPIPHVSSFIPHPFPSTAISTRATRRQVSLSNHTSKAFLIQGSEAESFVELSCLLILSVYTNVNSADALLS